MSVTLHVREKNGLAPVVTAEGTGIIKVNGTATFYTDTFVRPTTGRDAVADRYKILEAGTLAGGGTLKLTPEAKASGLWRLSVVDEENAIYLFDSHPATVILVR